MPKPKKQAREHDCLMVVLKDPGTIIVQLLPGAALINEKTGLNVINDGLTVAYILELGHEPK